MFLGAVYLEAARCSIDDMNWKTHISGSSRIFSLEDDTQEMAIEDILKEVWVLLWSEMLPLNSDVVWDYIKIELWVDSGRIIAYPASSKSTFRVEKAVCSVFFPLLLEQYETLSAKHFGIEVLEEVAEFEVQQLFEREVTELELEWIRKAELAAQDQIPEGANLRMAFYSTDDDAPLRSLII